MLLIDLMFTDCGPEPENPIIYNSYNDDVASEDGEHTIFDDYIEAPATEVAKGSVQKMNELSKD